MKISGTNLLLGGLAVAAVATAARTASASSSSGPKVRIPEPSRRGREDLRSIGERIGLSENWIRFLEATAKNESNFNNLASRGNPARRPTWAEVLNKDLRESDMAEDAYDRNKSWVGKCGWPRSRYVFGTGGWFAQAPVYGVAAFRDTDLACLDPWAVFDPESSVVMALGQLRRTMRRREAFANDPTWVNLRIGWGNPSKIGDPETIQAALTQPRKFAARLEQLGYDPSMATQKVDPMPPGFDAAQVLRALKGGSLGAKSKRTRARRGRGGHRGMGVAA